MAEDHFSQDIKDLKAELERLNGHRFIRVHNSTWRLVWFQFLRGLAFGFGSVVGASIVVSIVGFMLNQMEVVPIIGDWAKQLAGEIMQDAQQMGAGQ
ncbi:DUF5665 domain-containing protein [Celeribacter neptunius]|uniref:Uncharacterized protein n=1 Tax=Celeribacter neptunius TaxID=588602 RepID=A0A1I3RZU3_9RHOB|nr:DUF5665 domain-containing protein [Celeribacter neptunius]SFJ51462.1 hypothetical protein SAMN04487991_2260 [Celeribacter neptunius]